MTADEIYNIEEGAELNEADVELGILLFSQDAVGSAGNIASYSNFLNNVLISKGQKYYHDLHNINKKYLFNLENMEKPQKESLAFLYLKEAEYFSNFCAYGESLKNINKAIALGEGVPSYFLSFAYNNAVGILWNSGLYEESKRYMDMMEELTKDETLPLGFAFINDCNLMNGYAILGDKEKSQFYYNRLLGYKEEEIGPAIYMFLKLFKLSDEARLNRGGLPSRNYLLEFESVLPNIRPGNGVEEEYGTLFIPIIEYVRGFVSDNDLVKLCETLIETTLSLPDKINIYRFMFREFGFTKESNPQLFLKYYATLENHFDMISDTRKNEAIGEILNSEMAEKYKASASTDALTGLGNRYAYETTIKEIGEEFTIPNDLIVIMMDLNGLKRVNDTYGHDAGDEYIKGAGKCIKETFSAYGRVFRVGGDEFVAVINTQSSNMMNLLSKLASLTESWEGSYTKKLTISVGYSESRDVVTLEVESAVERVQRMLKIADRRMYEAKKEFYAKSGENRRA